MKKSKHLLASLIVAACLVTMAFPVSAASDDVVYGKVTAVNGSDVTVAVGTLNTGTPGSSSGAMPEMLTLTGESLTFTLTDDMAITKSSPGQPPESGSGTTTASSGSSTDATATDIVVGGVLKITYTTGTDAISSIEILSGNGAPGGAPGGGSATVSTGAGAYILTDGETLSGGTYSSTNDDENAIRAEGAITASINGATIEKTAGTASSSDASSFYGLNAAVLALDNAILNITGGSVTATSEGSNGVFAYNGATINIADTTINVTGGNAGGIEVAGGGNLYASNLTVNSTVKAAIRSDRGGGTMVVNGGTYTTSGSTGAPAIYSTADITVNDATLNAETSEAIVVEGLNSVTLNNCAVSGNMTGSTGDSASDNIHNVMLYQSMSGDAQVGNSSFNMTGGSLTANSGDMFYITNTESKIALNNVDLTLAADSNLLTVAGNDGSRGWGTAGSNGGKCVVNASNQTLSGDIAVDAISTLDLTLQDSSSFTGSINSDKTTAAALKVTLEKGSTWKLTGDSYITEFDGDASGLDTNGHTLYVNGVAFDGASTATGNVIYSTHVQNVGWQNAVSDGALSGTVGQSLRLEGITIESGIDGLGIEYATHVQNLGWQNYVADGAVSGTQGQSLRLEAIKIQLTGAQAENYDVYYRVQVENLGWLGWAANGAEAGSAGYGYRLEGIEIVVVEKGAAFDTGGTAFYEAAV
jgi:hypothetical protein